MSEIREIKCVQIKCVQIKCVQCGKSISGDEGPAYCSIECERKYLGLPVGGM